MAEKKHEKLIDEIGKMTVLQLSEFVKELEDKFDVSAAMPVAAPVAAAPSAEAAPTEEKTEYKVTLKEVGEKKIDVIKALRKVVQGLGLSDAKKAVDNAPSVIAESASKEDAEKMKKELEAVGAKVELA